MSIWEQGRPLQPQSSEWQQLLLNTTLRVISFWVVGKARLQAFSIYHKNYVLTKTIDLGCQPGSDNELWAKLNIVPKCNPFQLLAHKGRLAAGMQNSPYQTTESFLVLCVTSGEDLDRIKTVKSVFNPFILLCRWIQIPHYVATPLNFNCHHIWSLHKAWKLN